MPKAIAVPPGTVFGRLTVIEPARTAGGRRGMLCQCECGKRRIAAVGNLRSGHTRSCGCFSREIRSAVAGADLCEIPLYGKHAHGRTALVDPGDFALVVQYRWRLVQQPRRPGRKPSGPYAITSLPRPGDGTREKAVMMHVLIMGFTGIDHHDGNGLNNQRSNLRPATTSQNKANGGRYSGRHPGSSRFKGVYWHKNAKRWHAMIRVGGQGISLGYFHDETEAARAYDAGARKAFGKFAQPNFPAS